MCEITSIKDHIERKSNEGLAEKTDNKIAILENDRGVLIDQIVLYGKDIVVSHLISQVGIYNSQITELKMEAARLRRM